MVAHGPHFGSTLEAHQFVTWLTFIAWKDTIFVAKLLTRTHSVGVRLAETWVLPINAVFHFEIFDQSVVDVLEVTTE